MFYRPLDRTSSSVRQVLSSASNVRRFAVVVSLLALIGAVSWRANFAANGRSHRSQVVPGYDARNLSLQGALSLSSANRPSLTQDGNSGLIKPDAETRNRLLATYGKLPLAFEANHGQVDSQVKFLSRGSGYTLFLTGKEAVLALRQPKNNADQTAHSPDSPEDTWTPQQAVRLASRGTSLAENKIAPANAQAGKPVNQEAPEVLRMALLGADPNAKVDGMDELSGKTNYFVGNDQQKWRRNVPTYSRVRYQGVYPGVDLVYYGNQSGRLEYDFIVAPGADPNVITLSFAGSSSVQIDRNTGDLLLKLGQEEVHLQKPIVYQSAADDSSPATVDGARSSVKGQYVLRGHNRVA